MSELEGPTDEAVSDYLAAMLEENTMANIDLEDLDEMLQGFSPAFAALTPEKRHERLWALLRQVNHIQSAPASSEVPGAAVAAAPAQPAGDTCDLLHQLSLLSKSACAAADSEDHGEAAGAAQQSKHAEAAHRAAQSYMCPEPLCQELDTLQELCPESILRPFLSHVLRERSDCDVQKAAQWLVECEDVEQRQEQWLAAQRRVQEEKEATSRAEQASRKHLLAKYMLQSYSSAAGPKKSAAPLTAWSSDNANQQHKARYRDGKLVTTRGDKFVIEDLSTSWDGGSKGKVVTKGKRGKGYV
ncbi:hypothetical protein WJX72_004560 [[Myrmecia] bisecta]|uniref:Uncharacterized protein n=1 Tax=[Myrmecia] bisecta TaxID=41462 RepID=A0AAW1PJY3_9CHLO